MGNHHREGNKAELKLQKMWEMDTQVLGGAVGLGQTEQGSSQGVQIKPHRALCFITPDWSSSLLPPHGNEQLPREHLCMAAVP